VLFFGLFVGGLIVVAVEFLGGVAVLRRYPFLGVFSNLRVVVA
jgi:hypothetical protein